MEFIFSLILVSIESASAVLLFSSCLEWRPRFCFAGSRICSPRLRFVCAWLLLLVITFIFSNLFQGNIWLKLFVSFLLHLAYDCLVWQINWLPMIALSAAYLTLSNSLECLTAGFFCTMTGTTVSQLLQSYLPFVLVAVFTKILLLGISYYLRYTLLQARQAQSNESNWVIMIALAVTLLLLSLFIIDYLLENGTVTMQLVVTILFSLSCAVLYMTQGFRADAAVQMHKKNEQELIQQNREQRAVLHDTTNFSLAMQRLLEQGKQQQALELLRQQIDHCSMVPQRVYTDNPVVDVVLNDQFAKAAEQGIQLHIELCSLKNLAMRELDIVTLLTNLLDNARNACAQCPNVRRIAFVADQVNDGQVRLVIRNTYAAVPTKCAPQNNSAKVPLHGYGKQNVYKILKKYDCYYVADQADCWYRVLVLLPCSISSTEDIKL